MRPIAWLVSAVLAVAGSAPALAQPLYCSTWNGIYAAWLDPIAAPASAGSQWPLLRRTQPSTRLVRQAARSRRRLGERAQARALFNGVRARSRLKRRTGLSSEGQSRAASPPRAPLPSFGRRIPVASPRPAPHQHDPRLQTRAPFHLDRRRQVLKLGRSSNDNRIGSLHEGCSRHLESCLYNQRWVWWIERRATSCANMLKVNALSAYCEGEKLAS